MTSRRTFLSTLVAGAILDPERMLFVPGRKLISIPRPVALSPTTYDDLVAMQLYRIGALNIAGLLRALQIPPQPTQDLFDFYTSKKGRMQIFRAEGVGEHDFS